MRANPRGRGAQGTHLAIPFCICVCVCDCGSHITLCLRPTVFNPSTVALQSPLSMEFPRQDYWSGLLFPPPKDLPNPGIKPTSLPLAGGFFTTAPAGKPIQVTRSMLLLFRHQVVSNSVRPHGLQQAGFPCPSPSPKICRSRSKILPKEIYTSKIQ